MGYEFLHLRKIPHILTDEIKEKRVRQANFIISSLETAKKSHNANIITGDESWFYYSYPPKARWVLCGEEVEDYVAPSQFSKKKMVTIFIKQNGTFFVELLPSGETYDANYFREVIIPQIHQLAFPNGITRNTKRALLHFDNAPAHKEHLAMKDLTDNHFKLILNPPYSPDIAPLDFGVFGTIKGMMPIEMGDSEQELKNTITDILNGLGPAYIKKLFQAWPGRLHQVVDTNGLYIK